MGFDLVLKGFINVTETLVVNKTKNHIHVDHLLKFDCDFCERCIYLNSAYTQS